MSSRGEHCVLAHLPHPSPPLAEDLGMICLQGRKKRLNTASVPSNDLRAKTSRCPKTALTPSPLWLPARPSPTRDLSLFIICITLSRSSSDGVFSVPKKPSARPSFCFLVFENLNKNLNHIRNVSAASSTSQLPTPIP